MRIPTNSNFSREIAKRFETIFHREMSLGGLQDLQEQSDLSYNPIYINPVDSYLVNQVIQLKGNGHEQSKKNVPNARAVRQEYSEKESIVRTIAKSGTENKKVSLEITSS
jgi:hypothetical protein